MPAIRREVRGRRGDDSSEIMGQVQARPGGRPALIEVRLQGLADDLRPVAAAFSRYQSEPVRQRCGYLDGHCPHGITIVTKW
jgi:hypothetical protein